jgi:hypothetical protein
MAETSTPKSETTTTRTTTGSSQPAIELTELDKFRIQRDAIRSRRIF